MERTRLIAQDGIKNCTKKIELHERDLAMAQKKIDALNTQIAIKNFCFEDVKNKLENKLLLQCDLDDIQSRIKIEKE